MTMYPSDGGTLTGTPDKDYNILWFTEACLSYGADEAKQPLAARIAS